MLINRDHKGYEKLLLSNAIGVAVIDLLTLKRAEQGLHG